ncbi:hypothetical protein LPJ75_001966, partial [Coemansia sp. RSA 2598]
IPQHRRRSSRRCQADRNARPVMPSETPTLPVWIKITLRFPISVEPCARICEATCSRLVPRSGQHTLSSYAPCKSKRSLPTRRPRLN